jgi:hypothetical protein
MIDQGRHSIVPFYAQGSKKVYYYNFYYLQAVFFCCGLGIPALCEELNRTNHWHKNTPYSTADPDSAYHSDADSDPTFNLKRILAGSATLDTLTLIILPAT